MKLFLDYTQYTSHLGWCCPFSFPAAIGFIIALFGAIGFLISGNYLNANLPLSIGFLNIPAFLIFFPVTAFMARLGAKASHRINKKKMTKYFGLFLIIIGTKFLYEYFNL